MTNVVIVSAARTPVGSFNGSFAATPAHDLGAAVLKAVCERAGVSPDDVSETILGQVLTAGQGQNPARQAHINAGLPMASAAWSLNQVCGSGLRAVALGAQHIALGDDAVVIAGGQESMSLSPHVAHLRAGQKMGDMKFIDSMIKDGLWDAFHGYHMGTTAENVATKWQITREEQDEFALASQNKAEAAQKAGKFKDEIAPFTVKTRKGDVVVENDEYIRHGATIDGMQKLRPAFSKDGTVTAGNASGLNDGAAAVLLMTEDEAAKRGLEPLARIASWATAGVDPAVMGSGPIPVLAQGAGEGRLEGLRPRPRRGQRGLRGAGARGQQGHGLGSVDRERQRRRHRHRPPDRRLRRPHPQHPAPRDEAPRRQEGPRHALHRRRHGRRALRRALTAVAYQPARLSGMPRAAAARPRRGTTTKTPNLEGNPWDEWHWSRAARAASARRFRPH